jgi:hypothetical protein
MVAALLIANSTARADEAPTDQAFEDWAHKENEHVGQLVDRIARAKAELIRIQSVVTDERLGESAQTLVQQRNDMGRTFLLEGATYFLDGALLFSRVDTNGNLAYADQLEIFRGHLSPGRHLLAVQLRYKGHAVGPFSYLNDYHLKVSSSFAFDAEAGKLTTIRAVGYQKSNPTLQFTERPDIRFETESLDLDSPGGNSNTTLSP